MSNTLITPQIIAREALFHLENNVIMGDKVHRQYRNEFVKIGDSLTIRRPVRFRAVSGATRVNQDVIEDTTSIVVNQRRHVSWRFSSQDLTLTIDEYAERYIKPAMIQLANSIDQSLTEEGSLEFFNYVGTPGEPIGGTGTDPYATLAAAARRLDEMSVPDDGNRCMVITPRSRWNLAQRLGASGSAGVFNADIVYGMARMGYLGRLANFEIYGDQNMHRRQVGADVDNASILVNGAPSTGASTLALDGFTASTANALRRGDVITFAGVNAVDTISKQDLARPAEFVVTADVTSDGSGAAASVPISPTMFDGSGNRAAFQNVSALPADNAAVSIVGSGTAAHTNSAIFPQNLAFHKNALALVTVPLELPDSATFKARANWRGYSIRVIKDYDIDSDDEIIRLDILYGVRAIYPDVGVKIWE